MTLLTLNELPTQQQARIHNLQGLGLDAERFMAIGLKPGRWITLLRKAPLGGPLHVQIGHFELLLRPEQAALIEHESMASA